MTATTGAATVPALGGGGRTADGAVPVRVAASASAAAAVPMNGATGRDLRITLAQWGEIDDELGLELVEGRLERRPDVALWHDWLLSELIILLGSHIRQADLGALFAANGKLRVGEFRGRKPDLFWVRKDQYHLIGRNIFHGVPPLVVEIISPGGENERRDRVVKRDEYAALGVGEYWLMDFPARTVQVLRLADGRYEQTELVAGIEGTWRPELFPGLEIPLERLWPEAGNPDLE